VGMANEYVKSINSPSTQQLIANLKAYGRTHPDFAPILAKYHLSDAASPPPTKAPPAPAPTKAPTAPKK
jgi:hypothetical protein